MTSPSFAGDATRIAARGAQSATGEGSALDRNPPIVIVSAGDRDFAMPMAMSLYSALSTLDPARSVFVYLIADGISASDQARCLAVVENAHHHATVEWVTPDASTFSSLPTSPWNTRATYLRLLIPALVPKRFERVLYLDGDVIVARDLAPLWSVDMGDHPVLAVENFSEPTLGTALPQVLHHIDAPPDTPYFNAGVLLMDMPRWRERMIAERALDFLHAHGDQVLFADQDALNAVLAGDWGQLDPSWNIQLLTLSHYGHHRYDERERRERQNALLSNPGILHYTGPRKPWHWGYGGPADGAFLRGVVESGWFGSPGGQAWRAGRALSHMAYRGLRTLKRAVTG